MNGKPTTLLKVVSILYIIFSAVALVVAIIALFGSALLGVATGSAVVGWVAIIFVVIQFLGVIIQFVAGISGLKGNLKLAGTLSWIILIFACISFVNGLMSGTFSWTSVSSLLLPILFFIGVSQSKKA